MVDDTPNPDGRQWSTLLPPPETIKNFRENGAEDIIEFWKSRVVEEAHKYEQAQQRLHALEIEKLRIEQMRLQLQATEVKRGQYFGLFIGLTALLIGAGLTIKGAPWAGGFIGTGGVVGLVAVFVIGRHPRADSGEIGQ